MYILKPSENDFVAAFTIINLYKELIDRSVTGFYLHVDDEPKTFSALTTWSSEEVFQEYVSRFHGIVKKKVYSTLMRLYWNLFGPVSLDIPVFFRIRFDNELLRTYSENIGHVRKSLTPKININYSERYSTFSYDEHILEFSTSPFWDIYSKRYVFTEKPPKSGLDKVELKPFPICDWCAINLNMIHPKQTIVLKKLIFNKKIRFLDIMNKNQISDPAEITRIMRKKFMFDACVYNDTKSHTLVGSVDIVRMVDETKKRDTFKGFYKYEGHLYRINGRRSNIISTQSGRNLVPKSLIDTVPFLKENHVRNSEEVLHLIMPIPSSPGFIMNKLSLHSVLGIVTQKSLLRNIKSLFESDYLLMGEMSTLYPRVFSSTFSVDSKSKREWDIKYISKYDKDFTTRYIISFASVQYSIFHNSARIKSIYTDNNFDNYNHLLKLKTLQNKKKSEFGHNIGRLRFFSDIYQFSYTRKHQSRDTQPIFVHPYSMWLQMYDPSDPVISNTIDVGYLNNLLRITKIYTLLKKNPVYIETLYPDFYRDIRLLQKHVHMNSMENLYLTVFRIVSSYKSVHITVFRRKLYWICTCLIYKKYAQWVVGEDVVVGTKYGLIYTMSTIIDFIYTQLTNDGMIQHDDTWVNLYGSMIVGENTANPLKVFPLDGQDLPWGKKSGGLVKNKKIVGFQIPLIPIMLPGINPLVVDPPSNFNIYDMTVNSLGNIRFPIVDKIYKGSEKFKYHVSIYLPPNIKVDETSFRKGYNVVVSVGQEPKKSLIINLKSKNKIQTNRQSMAGTITPVPINNMKIYNLHIVRHPDYIFTQLVHILTDSRFKYIFESHPFSDTTIQKIKDIIDTKMNKDDDIYRNLPIDFKYVLELDNIKDSYINMYLYYAYMLVFRRSFDYMDNIVFKDDFDGIHVLNSFQPVNNHVHIKLYIRENKDIFERHNINIKTPHRSFMIQERFYEDENILKIRDFYNFLLDKRKSPPIPNFVKSYFIQVKKFNIFNHLRYIEYVTKTNIILVYNRNTDYFVYDRSNYYFNPRYKKIAVMFVLTRETHSILVENKEFLTSMNNQMLMLYRNESNRSSWTDRDWYITPIMMSMDYISTKEYLKINQFEIYDEIIGIINEHREHDSYRGFPSLNSYLKNLSTKKISNSVSRIKPSTGFSIRNKGNKTIYSIDTDSRDDTQKIIAKAIRRFGVADDKPKDIGFINEDGFVKTWVMGDKIYSGDSFSTHESCRRIIRIEFLRKIVNENRYIIYNKNTSRDVEEFVGKFKSIKFNNQRLESNMHTTIESKGNLARVISMIDAEVDSIPNTVHFSVNLPKHI